ncbi:hypothetical protein Bca52824_012726 [Brassica carinata]|uniref:MATH domain-containing protein n=1 Tax=Brassica carinata TaxID=52824 RepID=A0A8X7VZB7_BRACI|nr:hypothetical protein Bca52824_012726 [Brassica carinata]
MNYEESKRFVFLSSFRHWTPLKAGVAVVHEFISSVSLGGKYLTVSIVPLFHFLVYVRFVKNIDLESTSRTMGNEANKKFTWVIKNFSSFSSYGGGERVYSDIFVAGRCKWRLLASSDELYSSYLSLYLVVPNPESLPSGWRRHAKFSFTLVNQIPGEVSKLRETQYWFHQKDHSLGFESMIRLNELNTREFLVNNELKIVADVEVLEVVGKLDVPLETTEMVDINGFQVLASQVEAVNSLFEKHPDIASNFRPKVPNRRTTCMNILLSVSEILCKSPEELSNGDLADAFSSLRYVANAEFKLDWLEEALKEAGKTRIRKVEEVLNGLTKKRAEMNALLEFLK